MKPIMLFLAFLVFSVPRISEEACALDTPYIVIGEDVWLMNERSEKIFLLPTSYYAPVVGIDELTYSVAFNGVTGKVAKSSVSVTGYSGEVAGTTQSLHISPKYSAFTALKMRAHPSVSSEEETSIPVGETFTYIGRYPTADGEWYYVSYGEVYGYVPQEFCDKKAVEDTFVPDKTESPPAEQQQSVPEQEENDLLKILVISGVAVTVVGLLLVLLLPKRGKKTKYYYET